MKLWRAYLVGFLGGLTGALLVTSTPLSAASQNGAFRFLEIFNNGGKRVAVLAPGQVGQGTLWLYDETGGPRIEMGTYEAAHERGQPEMALHDRSGHIRALWRLHDTQDSPVIVFKDKAGYDKLVFGLRGNEETPYFEYVNEKGRTIDLLKK